MIPSEIGHSANPSSAGKDVVLGYPPRIFDGIVHPDTPTTLSTLCGWNERGVVLSVYSFLGLADNGTTGSISVVFTDHEMSKYLPYFVKEFPKITFHCYQTTEHPYMFDKREAAKWSGKNACLVCLFGGSGWSERSEWHESMRPKLSLFELGAKRSLSGDVFLPVWGSVPCVVSRKDAKLADYDMKKIYSALSWYRAKTYLVPGDCPNMDHCFDCLSEMMILSDFTGKKSRELDVLLEETLRDHTLRGVRKRLEKIPLEMEMLCFGVSLCDLCPRKRALSCPTELKTLLRDYESELLCKELGEEVRELTVSDDLTISGSTWKSSLDKEKVKELTIIDIFFAVRVLVKHSKIPKRWMPDRKLSDTLFEMGARIDCFSSSVDSFLLGRGVVCSEEELDKDIGCLGSFLEADLDSLPGDLIVNPPLDKEMNAVVRRVMTEVENGRTVYLFYPTTIKVEGIEKYLVGKIAFGSTTCYVLSIKKVNVETIRYQV